MQADSDGRDSKKGHKHRKKDKKDKKDPDRKREKKEKKEKRKHKEKEKDKERDSAQHTSAASPHVRKMRMWLLCHACEQPSMSCMTALQLVCLWSLGMQRSTVLASCLFAFGTFAC